MTTTHTNIEYIHSLTEDIGNLKESITLQNTSTPSKLESYTAFNGTGFIQIPPDKVQVLKRTTTTTIEVTPVDHGSIINII